MSRVRAIVENHVKKRLRTKLVIQANRDSRAKSRRTAPSTILRLLAAPAAAGPKDARMN